MGADYRKEVSLVFSFDRRLSTRHWPRLLLCALLRRRQHAIDRRPAQRGAQQQTRRCCCTTMGQTDGLTTDRYMDSALHTMPEVSVTKPNYYLQSVHMLMSLVPSG